MENDFYQHDLSIPNSFDHILKDVDYVYHLADVVAGISYVFNNQGNLFRHNLMINCNVVDAVKRNPVKGYIYVGTACSFPAELQSGIEATPLKEEDQYPANPESAYGWSKLMGEYETFLLEEESGIPVCVLTLHNVYGAPCDFDIERSQVIPSLIRKAICYPNEDFIVWGSGNQGRAFVHVDDIVDSLVLAKDKGLGKGLIQIGPDHCTSIREIAETVVRISGKPIDIVYDTTKPEGDKGRCADYSKARQVLGWEPIVDLQRGLENLYKWIEQRIQAQRSVEAA
jgi:nucleoside-diphosphate-sugar epimerase